MSTPVIPPGQTGTVTGGPYAAADGTLAQGYVLITPSPEWVKIASTPYEVVPLPVRIDLVDGEIPPTELVATDAAGNNPTGDWTYHVSFHLDCVGLRAFDFELPAGTTVDLIRAQPVAESDGTPIIQGPQGPAGTVTVGSTTTGAPGTDADVTNSGTPSDAVLHFTIPAGEPGDAGTAATVAVGDTTTGAPGTDADVTNSGTSTDAVLEFTIPAGVAGTAATVAVGDTTTGAAGTPAAVSNSGTPTDAVLDFTIPKGDPGDPGDAATIAVGSTTTGAAGTPAAVSNSGDEHAAVLDFVIPEGSPGTPGDDGAAATVAVGTTTTGAAGTDAEVSNSGDEHAAVLDFTIPRGPQGVAGDSGWLYSSVDTLTVDTYTVVAGDLGKLIVMSYPTAITVTVDDSTDLTVGGSVDFMPSGNGMITVVGGGTIAIGSESAPITRARYTGITITNLGGGVYWVVGGLA